MNWYIILDAAHLLTGIVIVALVLIQKQDAGFYGQSGEMTYSRRGMEKLVYNATISAGTIFVLLSIANFLI